MSNKVLKTSTGKFLRYAKLGKAVKISPKSYATVLDCGASVTYETQSVRVNVGIGKDHVAELMMSKDAFDALNLGAELIITSIYDLEKSMFEKK